MQRRFGTVLGPDGRPLPPSRRIDLAAQYDVGYTTDQNSQHWGLAIAGDANTAYDQSKRQKSRLRARYETANNAHLRGMVETKTADTIGEGAQLQVLTENGNQIESLWHNWAQQVGLVDKLFSLWCAKQIDGEMICLLRESQLVDHEIQLDLMPIESEQMGNPGAQADTEDLYDGVRHQNGRPLEFYIYDQHPNAYGYSPIHLAYQGQWYDESRVVHCYRKYRIGQLRGATELGPALELAAILRRYTMATLKAAEAAASVSLWLETDGSPEEGPQSYDGGAFQSFPVVHNMVITAPYGWHAKQIKSEHPDQQYETFVRAIVTQMGRSLGLPAALSYGDSSTYNMASGRLDFQTYIRALQTERAQLLEPACLEKIFLVWMRYYLAQRSGISPSSIDAAYIRANYPHRWAYRPINHSDPEKQAAADVQEWEAGLLTDDEFLYRRGIDPETHYESLARQNERRKALGMRLPGDQPGLQKQEGGGAGGRRDSSTESERSTANEQ